LIPLAGHGKLPVGAFVNTVAVRIGHLDTFEIIQALRLGTAYDVMMPLFIRGTHTKKPLCAWL
jgi:hypothetical protein